MTVKKDKLNFSKLDFNKYPKNSMIIVIVFLIIVVLFYVLLIGFQQPLPKEKAKDIILKSIPKVDCDLNVPILMVALEKKDLIYCDCFSETDLRESCKINVMDSLLFDQAISKFNSDLCDSISSLDLVALCKISTNKAIDYMAIEDPNFLAYRQSMGNDYNLAITTLEKNIDLNKNDIVALSSLSLAYANKALVEHKENELLPLAIKTIDLAIALNPDYAELYRIKGFIYEVQGDYFSAINQYNISLQKDPKYIPAYVNRGHAYNKQGDLYAAVLDFEKAKQLDTKQEHTDIYAQLCRLYSSNDNNISAGIENCKIVIQSKNATADNISGAYLTLGETYLRVGDLNNAYNQFKLGETYFPNSPDILSSLARYYNIVEDYSSAKTYANKAIMLDPMRAVAYKSLSYALYQLEDLDKAEEEALKGLSFVDMDASLLSPNKKVVKKDFYYILANIYHYKGDTINENKYKTLGDNE